MIEESTTAAPLLGDKIQVYGRRWYILLTFASLAVMQATTWNIFAPVPDPVRAASGWSVATTAWVTNVANVSMMGFCPLASYAASKRGARAPTVACALLLALSGLLRVSPLVAAALGVEADAAWKSRLSLYVAYGAMALNGASAAWLNFAGPLVSEAWFPATERATATAVLSVAPYIGVSLGYVVGPLAAPGRTARDPGAARAGLGLLELAETLVCLLLLASVAAYWPSRPPKPPSLAAAAAAPCAAPEVGAYTAFLKPARATKRFWAVCLAFAGPVGVFGGWGAVLAPSLKSAGVSEAGAGWLGCAMNLAGCVGAVVIGAVVDRFQGRMKAAVLASYALGTLSFLAFAYATSGGAPASVDAPWFVLTTGVLGGLFLNTPIPLLFELAAETTHGVLDANATPMILVLLVTAVQVVFLGVAFVGPGTSWMSWLMAFSFPVCSLPLALMRAEYPRLELDDRRLRVGRIDGFGIF